MENELKQLEKYILTDKNDLGNECEQFSEQFYKVGELFTKVVSLRDECEKDLKDLEAMLDRDIRSDSNKTNTKITEAAIKNLIILNDKYQEFSEKYLQVNKQVKSIENLKRTMEKKADMLGYLKDLLLNGFITMNSVKKSKTSIKENDFNESLNILSKERK